MGSGIKPQSSGSAANARKTLSRLSYSRFLETMCSPGWPVTHCIGQLASNLGWRVPGLQMCAVTLFGSSFVKFGKFLSVGGAAIHTVLHLGSTNRTWLESLTKGKCLVLSLL